MSPTPAVVTAVDCPSDPATSAEAYPLVVSCAERRAARNSEIARDAGMVAAALCNALRRLLDGAASLPLEQIWARAGEALDASREAHHNLNNARINLRACRSVVHADSAPLPASLTLYRHRGNYRGAFRSMAELGNCLRGALGITAGLPASARTALARELHLRGDIWTFEHEGAVHVFGQPGSGADLILASERPRPDDSPPSPIVLEALTS